MQNIYVRQKKSHSLCIQQAGKGDKPEGQQGTHLHETRDAACRQREVRLPDKHQTTNQRTWQPGTDYRLSHLNYSVKAMIGRDFERLEFRKDCGSNMGLHLGKPIDIVYQDGLRDFVCHLWNYFQRNYGQEGEVPPEFIWSGGGDQRMTKRL